MGWESKPSSVPDGHLSRPQLGPATSSPSWRLSTSGLGEQPANGRFGDCCGEDCPFHPGGRPPVWSLLLWRRNASDHPCPPHTSVVNVRDSPEAISDGYQVMGRILAPVPKTQHLLLD